MYGKSISFLRVLITLCSFLLKGFILSEMWQWFLVPLEFEQVTFLQSLGLILIVELIFPGGELKMSFRDKDNKGKGDEAFDKAVKEFTFLFYFFISTIVTPLIIYAVGYIIQSYI